MSANEAKTDYFTDFGDYGGCRMSHIGTSV
jgi:hypothetical protein